MIQDTLLLARKSERCDAGGGDVPFDINGYLTEIDTGKIDADYMNSRFDKYLKQLDTHPNSVSLKMTT